MQPQTKGFAQGNITTQNLNPNSGIPTAGSFVLLPVATDYDTVAIQVTGVYTGALSVQGTVDGVNWKSLGGSQALTDVNTAVQNGTIPSAATSIYQADAASFQALRVTALAAVTGTAVVSVAGSVNSGVVGIDTPIALAAGAALIGQVTPTTAASAITLNSAATTNATSSKASAGSLLEISASNMTAAIKYLKLYNKASAPAVGTDVPVQTIPIPANGQTSIEYGVAGRRFTTGIAFALTGAQAIADTTALAAGDVQVYGTYI